MRKEIILLSLCAILITAQEKNKQIVDEKSGKQILMGICDRSAFADTSYSWWFNSEYENYTPNAEVIEKIKSTITDVKITVIMGSWCSDSRQEVPRLYKILDAVQYDYSKLVLVCVDRNKKSPDGDVDKLEIKLVPTFVLSRDDKELGKILESPKNKLEEDLLGIIK